VLGYNNKKLERIKYITNAEITLKYPVKGTEDYMTPYFLIQSKNAYALEFSTYLLGEEMQKSVTKYNGMTYDSITIMKLNVPIFIGRNGEEVRSFKRDMNLISLVVVDHPYDKELSVIKMIGNNLNHVIREFKCRYSNIL
jgi:hypothetical protein